MRMEGRGIILFLREPFFGLLTRDRRVWEKYLELLTPSGLGWNLDSTITLGSEPLPPHLWTKSYNAVIIGARGGQLELTGVEVKTATWL